MYIPAAKYFLFSFIQVDHAPIKQTDFFNGKKDLKLNVDLFPHLNINMEGINKLVLYCIKSRIKADIIKYYLCHCTKVALNQ